MLTFSDTGNVHLGWRRKYGVWGRIDPFNSKYLIFHTAVPPDGEVRVSIRLAKERPLLVIKMLEEKYGHHKTLSHPLPCKACDAQAAYRKAVKP